ncbi:hypothetical protein PHACT_03075 [Pseudohongiella acticola]|uniref:SAM-dependent methyltransferase n=1 Tax=Pseudohongiella acticola TaxID=1524254 RepID=A0A1E8CIN4_9GAMM|nr:DUF938 domain-containing protein [Pseudohongiella acticola]OFE12239.1 hypothetical protein PHACT_03075 [Pseudohongiella acticola]
MSVSSDARRSSPSSARNREPIAQVLQRHLPARSQVLEIASGTGEHAVYLSQQLSSAHWWPSDINTDAISSINAWRDNADADAVQPALVLDVSRPPAETLRDLHNAGANPPVFDAIICINMIHISPWQATQGLMQTARALLREGGILYLYGPYRRHGEHTADSNALFDADLRSRDPRWGIRALEEVCELAATQDLIVAEIVDMPANNLSVVLQKHTSSDTQTRHLASTTRSDD